MDWEGLDIEALIKEYDKDKAPEEEISRGRFTKKTIAYSLLDTISIGVLLYAILFGHLK